MFATGVAPGYLPVVNRRTSPGRGLTEDDQKRRSPVAVLGSSLARKLLGGEDPVGRDILLEGVPFRIVVSCLAGTVMLVGGALSVMLISFSERRYEIGLRKAVGTTDPEIFAQSLLGALVLATLGALAGTLCGLAVCQAFSSRFPFGLMVSRCQEITRSH